MQWNIKILKKKKVQSPILIEGLPGIGNVGKIALDILIDQLKAEKLMEFSSPSMPGSVFVTQDNTIAMPILSLYHKKIKNQDFYFVTGDAQPVREEASHAFCELLVKLLEKDKVKYIITLGGIGLNDVPEKPTVYITGNDKKLISTFNKKIKLETNIYGVVGPIMGISGLLLGVSAEHHIPAISLLAETFGHPLYIGLKGVEALLTPFNTTFSFGIDLEELRKEIGAVEGKGKKSAKKGKYTVPYAQEVNYIG